MSAYDNDPRVRPGSSDYSFTVRGDDKYDVYAGAEDRWYTVSALDSRASDSVFLPSRADYGAWLLQRRTGPFPSRDAAIASLIGAPQ